MLAKPHLNINAHRQQQEQHSEPKEHRSEEADQQLLEDDRLFGRWAAFWPGDLEHKEPGGEEGADGQQNGSQVREHRRIDGGNVARHRFHDYGRV